MLKNLRIQLFIELELYQKLLLNAKERGYHFKSDSELVRITLFNYLQDTIRNIDSMVLLEHQRNEMKQDILKKQTVIELLQGQLREKRKAKEIKDINIEAKKKRRSKK